MSYFNRPDRMPRSGPDERDYLLLRAEAHRRLAEAGDASGSRPIHQRLQRLYEERAALVALVVPD